VRDKLASAKNISKSIKPGGILSIYEPTIEVRAVDMQKTTAMFERFGLKKEKEREGSFTRLRKHGGR
jgi:hypothetical protein